MRLDVPCPRHPVTFRFDPGTGANTVNDIVEGYASKESPLFQEMLAEDAGPLSAAIQARGTYRPSIDHIPFSTYTDRDYAAREMSHVWGRSWQYACREEDIPEVGDRIPYDVGPLSFIIIRTGPETFKAFYNACLHRGTRLCDASASGDEIKCPFHGWRWHVDGALKRVPGKWDFPDVDDSYALPEIRTASWGGCLFVNPDPECGPLEDALGVLVDHFAHFDLANRFTLVRTAKKIRANWKTVWAAFLEAYHVEETHFDALAFTGDANTQYDAFATAGAVISRLITPAAVPSPLLQDKVSAREAAVISVRSFAGAFGPEAPVTLPPYDEMPDFGRRDVAAWRRESMGQMMGSEFSHLSDSEMIDSIQYAMFPNFGPWLGEGLPLLYQFLPLGDNPDESLFTVRLMAPIPDGAPRPPCPPLTTLDFDEFFESIPEWGRIAHVFDQDMSNLPNIQRGMHSAAASRAQLTLGRYQEQRIALMHEFVEGCLAKA